MTRSGFRFPVVTLVAGLIALSGAACLGALPHDAAMERVASAPRQALALPQYESRPYWLLRAQSGWVSGHEIRFGGDPGDGAIAVVRTVRFRDDATAASAWARLTPDYLNLLLRDRVTWAPRPFAYPGQLAGDQVSTLLYGVRLPPEMAATGMELTGQLTAIRTGRVVLLIESIGVTPDRLIPAVEALTRAAGDMGEN